MKLNYILSAIILGGLLGLTYTLIGFYNGYESGLTTFLGGLI